VGAGCFAFVIPLQTLNNSDLSWTAFVVGFAAFSVFALVANTAAGDRVDEWIARRGIGGTVVLLGFVLVAFAVSLSTVPPGFGFGGLAGWMLYVLAYAALAGDISGWWADRL